MPRIQTENVNEASRFLASTLHEIRTPIQTIIGTLELISDTQLDKEQTEYVRQIQFSAEVLLDLANNILDFTKIRSKEFKLETIAFDIGRVAEMVVDLVSIEAFNKEIEIVTDISPRVPKMLLGDPVRVQQIILNLVKNAVKFTNHGYIHVELDYNVVTGLHFQVTDSGVGIPEEKQKKLFTDYFQGDVSTYRKFGGTGLGLSICKNLVSVMNGKIGVKQNPYGGSIFYFDLPLPMAADQAQENCHFIIEDSFRILIVDDNNLSARNLKKRLSRHGFNQIDIVSSAKEAMVHLQFAQNINRPYKVAFIDMTLPVVDGWHLANEIRNNTEISDMQLYLLIPEGQLRKEAKMKLLDWFNGYLYKPIKREKLFELMFQINSNKIPSEERTEVPEAEPKLLETAKTEPEENSEKKIKVLVAEDHPTNRMLLQTFLKKFNGEVYIACDGAEAIEQIEKNPEIQMIFMDIYMPNKSGVEATEEIRKKGYQGIIIACTANNDSNDFQDYMKIGMNDILVKPFKSNSIKEMMNKWKPAVNFSDFVEESKEKQKASEKDKSLLWDKDDFSDTTGGDLNLQRRLVSTYISQTDSLLQEMKNLLDVRDFDELQRIGHTLKGSSNSISAFALGEAGKGMEDSAKEKNLEKYMKSAKNFILLLNDFKNIQL